MNNKAMTKMKNILNIGAILLFIAGLIMVFSNMNHWSVLICFIFITAIYGGIAIILKMMNLDNSSKRYWFLALVGVVFSYIYLGSTILNDFWQSLHENGYSLFIISINLLIIILTTLFIVKYKAYRLIHLIYFASFMIILELFVFFKMDDFYLYLLFGILLLIFNIFNVNKSLPIFAKYMTYILAMTFLFDMEAFSLIPFTIIMILMISNFVVILKKSRDDETNIFSLIIIGLYLILFYGNYVNLLSPSASLIATTIIVSLTMVLVNYFDVFNNKVIKFIFNILANGFVLWLIISHFTMEGYTLLLMSSIFLIVSLIGNRHRKSILENYLQPFKMMLVIETGLMFVNNAYLNMEIIIYLLINLIALRLAMLSKNREDQRGYMLFVGLSIIQILWTYTHITPLMLIALDLILLADYLVATKLWIQKRTQNILYTVLILLLLLFAGLIDFKVNYLITILYLGFMVWKAYPEKYPFGITIPALYLTIRTYMNMMTINPDLIFVFKRLILLLAIYIWNMVIIQNERHEDDINVVALCLLFAESIFQDSLIILSFSLVLSIVLIIWGFMRDHLKTLTSIGLVLSLLAIIRLFSFNGLSSKGMALFFAFFGLLIIIYVIIRMKKEINREPVSVIEEKTPINYHRYCSNCGHKIKKEDKFCGHCGQKL